MRTDYESVFRTTYPAVVRTAFVIVGDRGLAEAVAQDAFARLHERWGGARTKIEQPQAWVHAVAVRMAVRRARRHRRRPTVARVDERPVEGAVVDVDLHRALGRLSPRQRAVAATYYLEERPVAEIALLLEVSPSAVKQHLRRAVQAVSDESRIREGLRANTQRLLPDLEHGEDVVREKVDRRTRARRARYAAAAVLVVAAAGVFWFLSTERSQDPSEPRDTTGLVARTTPLPRTGSLEPGTYEAEFGGGGPSTSRAVLDVPAGFVAVDGLGVLETGGSRGVSFWTADAVTQDPCDLSDRGEDPGPLVADLAEALETQEVTTATRPVRITLAGHDGLFLEVATPGRREDGCRAGRYSLWTTGSGGARHVGPGEVHSLWILDVDGERLVVDASGSDDGSEAGAQVDEMVDSVRFFAP